MNSDAFALMIRQWADDHLPTVLELGAYDNHITSIMDTSLTGAGQADSIDRAIDGFNILLKYLGARPDLQLILAIPLEDGKRSLKRNHPRQKTDIYEQWRSVEAPSLYITHQRLLKYPRRYIEYVHPLPYFESEFVRPVTAFYREWRSIETPHWEFTRSVIVESL